MKPKRIALIVSALGAICLIAPLAAKEPAKGPLAVSKTQTAYYRDAEGWFAVPVDRPNEKLPISTTRMIVQVDNDLVVRSFADKLPAAPAVAMTLQDGKYVVIDIPESVDPAAYLQQIQALPGVRAAEFDLKMEYHFASADNQPAERSQAQPTTFDCAGNDDDYFGLQWGFSEDFSHLPSAWALETGDPIIVTVLEGGVAPYHPDLMNAITSDSDFSLGAQHGTSVVGIIGARTCNGEGVAGVAGGNGTAGTGVMLRVKNPGATLTSLLPVLTAAGVAQSRVINFSGGVQRPTKFLATAVENSIANIINQYDMVMCVSSGNDDYDVAFPADDPAVIGVGAVLSDKSRWACSNFGPELDIVAAGGCGIVTTDLLGSNGWSSGDYTNSGCYAHPPICPDEVSCTDPGCFGGTSAAAPFVSGVAALMRSANTALHWWQVRQIILDTAEKVTGMNGQNFHEEYGYGLVNAAACVQQALLVPANGVISTNTTWSGPVCLTRDITVNSGVTLTIAAGAHIYPDKVDASNSGNDHSRVELRIQGSLVVNGTQANPVKFQSATDVPGESDWYGIISEGTGSVSLTYAEVRHARTGVRKSSSGSVSVTNSTFESNGLIDVELLQNGSCTFTGNTINVGTGEGIVATGTSLTVNNNTFTGSSISLDAVKLSCGLCTLSMDGNVISGLSTGAGIWIEDGSSTLKNNLISGCGSGILVNNGVQTVGVAPTDGNEIYGCGKGIHVSCLGGGQCPNGCSTLNVVVRSSNIHNNTYGVHAQKTVAVDLGRTGAKGNNIIAFNTTYCVWNNTTCGTIQAVGNYFGGCPPTCTSGLVNTANCLLTPPSLLTTGTGDTPLETRLASIHPNPFNPTTTIDFALKETAATTIAIYNVSGQLVRHESLGNKPAGSYNWVWNGTDQRGTSVSSGIYFVVLKAGSVTDRKKAVLLK